jgi:ribonuclease BN (tRNA processing enzyme)
MTNSFTILGSSSGAPQAGRACSGYVVRTGDSLSLIDCGGGVSSSFLRRGFDPLKIDRVFISHTHPDHCCELPLVIQMVYLAGRQQPLCLYLPEELVQPFEAFMPAVYLMREKLPFEIKIVGYSDGFVFDEGFRLKAVGNRHLTGNRELVERLGLPNKMQSHSFKIQVGGKSLFYSGDTLDFADVRDHLDGHDYAVLESNHLDLTQIFEHAGKIKVGQYIISHLGSQESVVKINEQARKYGIKNLTTAIDGMEIAF